MSNAKLAFNLSQKVGWPHTQTEWEMMTDISSLMAIGSSKKIYASALLTHYSWGASLGMVLVDPNERGFGLGVSITRQVFAATENDGIEVVTLTSSHDAKRLYQKVGFEKIGSVLVLKHKSSYLNKHSKTTQNISCTADEVSQAYYNNCPTRKKILEKIIDKHEPTVCLRDKSGNITAFASSIKRVNKNGNRSLAIGPILANSPTNTGQLLDQLIRSTSLDMTCFIFQNFLGESPETVSNRKSILEEFQKRNFVKSDELQFMSYAGKKVSLFLDSRVISPISLAFS